MNAITNPFFGRHGGSAVSLALLFFCLFVFLYGLGGAALFEPTEGRNAEIAREILITHDWVTPHDDFIPVLDKPIFFHWLIAISYKLFGVSEGSARLPSALAGLGIIGLIYLFAKRFLGMWQALWSSLILATSLQFFALSRIVIFDMPLTLFVTLSLCSFYWGTESDSGVKKRLFYLLMYAAMGVGALIKGPIGVFLPGMVIVFYMLAAKKWFVVRELEIVSGVILFLIIVAPWYVSVEIRNPGYLKYFLWEENFIRFLTPHFGRGEPSYYFVGVLAAGFLPWTFLLPYVFTAQWKKPTNATTLFLVFWTVLPFLFFSFSHTKLSHYILPMYPPLAIVAGAAVADGLKKASRQQRWPLWFPSFNLFLLFVILFVGFFWPVLLPRLLQGAVRKALHDLPGLFATGTVIGLIWVALSMRRNVARSQASLYAFCCGGFALYFLIAHFIVRLIAFDSSSKILAEKSAPLIKAEDQLVIYDKFRSSLPYYLNISRPIWIVWPGKGTSIMESFYIAEKQPQPAAAYGKALMTFQEFSQLKETTRRNLLVFVKKKNVAEVIGKNEIPPKTILDFNDYVLMLIPDSDGDSP